MQTKIRSETERMIKMSSLIVSSLSFFLLLVISLLMDEAFGAQTEIRKLKETMKMRKNSEGNDQIRISKIEMQPSETRRCGGPKPFEKMTTTYHPVHGHEFHPFPGVYSSSLCQACTSTSNSCYTVRCIITKRCEGYQGSPLTCTTTEDCQRIS